MKTLIIPDLHNRTDEADRLLDLCGDCDRVVILGDYFDHFHDRPIDVARVATWLKRKLDDSRITFLIGNHDQSYLYHNSNYICPGYSVQKNLAVADVLKARDWRKLRYLTQVGPYWVSHAGVSPSIFQQYGMGLSYDGVEQALAEAHEKAKANIPTEELGIGLARGGNNTVGGITWLDFDCEFVPVDGIHQIVGHSPHPLPEYKITDTSLNVCVDTHSNHIAIVEDDAVLVQRVDHDTKRQKWETKRLRP